jgi:hypothetical protein
MAPSHVPYPFFSKGNPNLIFIHIPKTAGTSLRLALGCNPIDPAQGMKKHYSSIEIISLIGKPTWEAAWKIAFVRNPWDRLYAHYRFRLRMGRIANVHHQQSFKAWMRYELLEHGDTRKKRPNLRPQRAWLEDETGKISIDFIGRFEALEEEYQTLANKMGLQKNLSHLEKGAYLGTYQHQYDDEMRAWVATYYHADIEMWGFEF